jgi:hypothetical protein
MKKWLLILMLLLPSMAQAQTLYDKGLLGTDPNFQLRVKVAVIQYALVVANESVGIAQHASRVQVATVLLNDQNFSWVSRLAALVATDSTVSSGPTAAGTIALTPTVTTCDTATPPVCTTVVGNLATRAALATDASITSAIAAGFNSLFAH